MRSLKKLNKLKLAFITGATKGIGRSTAITFANAGWDLILLSRNMDLMEKLKSELFTTKSKINLVKCDLSNPLEIEHCVREAIASGMVHFEFVEGSMNPADILSKHWGYSNVWPLLQPLLFHQGNTLDLADKPMNSDGTAHTDGE